MTPAKDCLQLPLSHLPQGLAGSESETLPLSLPHAAHAEPLLPLTWGAVSSRPSSLLAT